MLVHGKVKHGSLPAAVADGSMADLRMTRYGEPVSAVTSDRNVLATEGTFYTATNPTWGTGIAAIGATRTTFADTNCALLIVNSSTDTVDGPNIFLSHIRLTCTAAGTAGVNSHVGLIIDPNTRYSSGGTSLTPNNVNSGIAAASVATIYAGNVTSSASVAARQAGRAVLKTAAAPCWAVGDEVLMTFGGAGNYGSMGLLSGSSQISIHKSFGPVCLAPSSSGNHTFLMHMWASSQTASPSFEIEVGWFER